MVWTLLKYGYAFFVPIYSSTAFEYTSGTWDRDRVPIAGVVGRESKHLHLMVCHHSNRATLQP